MYPLKNIVFAAVVGCLFMSGCTTGDDGPRELVYYDSDLSMTYPEMAREISNGSVQIYDLDSPVASSLFSPNDYQGRGGVASPVDPNVTVYPFDDGFLEPRLEAPERVTLMPPSDDYRPLSSPFGGAIQSPAMLPLRTPPVSDYVRPHYEPPSRFDAFPISPVFAPAAPALAPVSGATSRIYYKHGSSVLNNKGKQVIGGINNGGKVSVEGHASARSYVSDPVERSIVNLKVSMDRAFKVSSALIRSGVPAQDIETKAYGATRPAIPAAGESEDVAGRRVEIYTEMAPNSIPPLARY